ncbi:MAG: fluoride efflux transporter CrcB [Muribaculaceae bacterium]|nr:fluoride efflux transporter CrcB [Muribaculaceae bacterium]
MIKEILIVGLGSGIGGMARYIIGRIIAATGSTGFPWATLTVNLLGCLIIGLVFGLVAYRGSMPDYVRLLLTVGFCGGFTTFSTFSHECYLMFTQGHTTTAAIYMSASLIGGLCLVFTGYWLVRQL